MPKKNREAKPFDEMENESSATETENTPSIPPETLSEAAFSDPIQQETAEVSPEEETSAETENEASSDDLLNDVRRSLLEAEETEKNKKEKQWWRRIGRKEKSAEPGAPPTIVEMDLPATSLQTDMVESREQPSTPERYEDEINGLRDMLEGESPQSAAEISPAAVEAELLEEAEREFDLDQLKEQA